MPAAKKSKNQQLIEELNLQTAKANAVAAIIALANSGAYLDTQQAAIYLGLKKQTLEVFRSQGIGPRCVFVATRPRYTKKALEEWIPSHGRRKRVAS
jgi:hypothetical protein